MKIEKLNIIDFRNFESEFLTFSDGINIIYGENGQGKTNLVEAIYLMNHSKSFRTRIDKEMINFNEELSYIKGKVNVAKTSHTIDIRLSKQKGKAINLNDYPLDKVQDMIGVINIVCFAPEDVKIVTGTPQIRRNFLDREISQLKPAYYKLILDYQTILKSKNAILKEDFVNPVMLDVYDEQIAELSEKIIDYRHDFVEKLSNIAGKNHFYISDEKETLKIEYARSFISMDKDGIISELKKTRENDIYRKTSMKGIHRDDLYLTLKGMNIRSYGSQGQKKTASISMKLAEIDLIYNERGEYPIVILDDIFSELDENRRKLLTEKFENLQLFITTTEKIDIENARFFHVQNGKVREE